MANTTTEFPSSPFHSLAMLLVFTSIFNPELIRTVHVYKRGEDQKEEEVVERVFWFFENGPYVETKADPLFITSEKFCPRNAFLGQRIDSWRCIFSFHVHRFPPYTSIPPILSITGNPKLKSVPSLVDDLEKSIRSYEENMVRFRMDCMGQSQSVLQEMSNGNKESPVSTLEGNEEVSHHFERRYAVCNLDLNKPYPISESDFPEELIIDQDETDTSGLSEERVGQVVPIPVSDAPIKKIKRVASKDIKKLSPEDLAKYFDHPIQEAAKILNVGLTVLKRKCREFGITRWPHRKLKSLNSLIHDLQEEGKRQQENQFAAKAVAKRQNLLEHEKAKIEKRPSIEIDCETKRFRQDVFKKRHKARALKKQESSESLK